MKFQKFKAFAPRFALRFKHGPPPPPVTCLQLLLVPGAERVETTYGGDILMLEGFKDVKTLETATTGEILDSQWVL